VTEPAGLPAGILIAFYGDDFTGSSAVMEVMTFAGLPAVMFVETPTPEQLERFRGYRAISLAGVARAQPPSWVDAHLPAAFRALAELGAPVTHYKVCSTLDSSPTVGSIGRAIDIGAPHFRRDPRGGEPAAARRRRAGHWALSGIRQPLRGVRRLRLPSRPPSGHATASGHTDG
jgi:hypothetical protein